MEEAAVFETVLAIQLDEANQPKVTYRFPVVVETPKNDVAVPVMRFCFPETEDPTSAGKKKKKKVKKTKVKSNLREQASETFSFVLTDSDGSRKFGYCRRMKILDKETSKKTLECYCLLSCKPSFSLFRQILDIVEERRKASKSAVYTFLKSILACKFPGPGETITVRTFEESYQLSRSLGTGFEYLDYVTYTTLFKTLPIPKILELFSNMLLERRCLLAASTLGTLSSCINALSSLLYPFSWQHVFIPVLPRSLLDYCCAPMPFLLGILSSSLPCLKNLPLEEVYIVDLDKGSFVKNPGFPNLLPTHEFRTLEMSLNAIKNSGSKGRIFDSEVARAFLDFFQSIFRDYPQFMRGNKFDVTGYKAAQPAPTAQFLQVFEESQMWSCFIVEREAMAAKGILQQCPLLKVLEVSQAERMAESDKPAVFQVCSKCGGDIDSDLEDKDGRPICQECLEAKNRRGGVGWFKSLMGGKEDTPEDKPGIPDRLKDLVRAGGSAREPRSGPTLSKGPSSTSAPSLPIGPRSFTSPAPVSKATLAEDPDYRSPVQQHSRTFNQPQSRPGGFVGSATSPTKPFPRPSSPPPVEREPDATANTARPAPVPSSQGVSNLTAKFQQSPTTTNGNGNGYTPNNNSNNPNGSPLSRPTAKPMPPKPGPPPSSPSISLSPPPQSLPGRNFQAGLAPQRHSVSAHPSSGKSLPPTPVKPGLSPSAPSPSGGGTGGNKFCSGCGKTLQEHTALNAMNGLWHAQCFVCAHCQQEFKNFKFVVCDNKPYHPACKRNAFLRTCKKCEKALEGKCVKADGNMYHQDCFVCGQCRAFLSGGYVEAGGQVYCEGHAP